MSDEITVRFRVADVYKDRSVAVYYGDERVSSRKKRIMAPGEMEQIVIKKSSLLGRDGLCEITVCLE